MEKKQTVLMVHNYYQVTGGEDTVMENEVRLLRENGHKVITYTRSNNELKKSKWKLILLPFSTIWSFKTYKETKKIIKEEHIDIVHCQNTFPLISPSVYYAAWKLNVPVVQTVHNFRFICANGFLYRDGHICEECIHNGLSRALRYHCYRNSKAQTFVVVAMLKIHRWLGTYRKLYFICLTEFNKNKLISLNHIKPENIYVKPNFTTESGITEINQKRLDQYIFVGRLDKLKGIKYVLEAWKKLDQKGITSKLLICGTGPEEEWCKRFIADNHLNNILMKGFINNDKVKKYIAESKGLVVATQWYEGFPMTIVEAYSVGTPVLCSRFGNAGDLVIEGKTGYKFKCDSSDEIVQAVEKNNKEPLSYNAIIQWSKDKYSPEENYRILERIYEEALNQKLY